MLPLYSLSNAMLNRHQHRTGGADGPSWAMQHRGDSLELALHFVEGCGTYSALVGHVAKFRIDIGSDRRHE